jgi:SAM-dependent methyltransferase
MNGQGLPPVLRQRLHGLEGRRLLHLGCGTGEATAELAALGALVTGVDADEDALAAARARAPEVPWLHGDAERLPAELHRGREDIVLAGPRSLAGASDLESWAAGLAVPLRPGGEAIVLGEHPILQLLDEVLRWRGDYFAADGPVRVGELVTAVARAGLLIRELDELPEHPPMRPQASRAPGQLVLVAAKPG